MPSGSLEVVELRAMIKFWMIGPGWKDNGRPIVPTVAHPTDIEEALGAKSVFVGVPCRTVQATQWSGPCRVCQLYVDCQLLTFPRLCAARANLVEWLMPLSGCTLVCDCQRPPWMCSAHHLAPLFKEVLDTVAPTDGTLEQTAMNPFDHDDGEENGLHDVVVGALDSSSGYCDEVMIAAVPTTP